MTGMMFMVCLLAVIFLAVNVFLMLPIYSLAKHFIQSVWKAFSLRGNAMETSENQFVARFVFIETLSAESIAKTGYGIYVLLTPMEIEQLYAAYQNLGAPIKDYARSCVKQALGR